MAQASQGVRAGGQVAGLQAIGRHEGGERGQQGQDAVDDFLVGQCGAATGGQHRIQHHRQIRVVAQQGVYCLHRLYGSQHADLDGRHRHVLQHGPSLVDDEFRVQGGEAHHPGGVLHRDGGDYGRRMAAHADDGFDVCLDAGTTGGIVARQGHDDGNRWLIDHAKLPNLI